jgi:hypothetical protein
VRSRGLSDNGTASGDSGPKTAGLPLLAVRMLLKRLADAPEYMTDREIDAAAAAEEQRQAGRYGGGDTQAGMEAGS